MKTFPDDVIQPFFHSGATGFLPLRRANGNRLFLELFKKWTDTASTVPDKAQLSHCLYRLSDVWELSPLFQHQGKYNKILTE